jgi:hypothetical protein
MLLGINHKRTNSLSHGIQLDVSRMPTTLTPSNLAPCNHHCKTFEGDDSEASRSDLRLSLAMKQAEKWHQQLSD